MPLQIRRRSELIKPVEPIKEIKPIIIEEDEKIILEPAQHDNFINEFKLKDAINLVRNVVPELKQKGLVAEVQEKDLGGKYQIIINIDK